MSSTFVTVDHVILLDHLHASFGISGTVLSWIESFVTSRTHAVHHSTTSAVVCGISQGSILGPLLFLLHIVDIFRIVQHRGLRGNSYADDTNIYLPTDASLSSAKLPTISPCIDDLNEWMSSNRLNLNADKTRFIWLGTAQLLMKINSRTITVTDAAIQVSNKVTCLGVVIDSQLILADSVKKLASSL